MFGRWEGGDGRMARAACVRKTSWGAEARGVQKMLNSWTCQRGEAETGRVNRNHFSRGLCSLNSSVDVTFKESCAFS